MEISNYILEEAKRLLQGGLLTLPAQLPSAPAFYLAEGNDESIIAFTAFKVGDAEYKIGTQKAVN